MLQSINFSVIKCLDCGATFKIEPGRPFEAVSCDCKNKTAAKEDTALSQTVKTRQRKSSNG